MLMEARYYLGKYIIAIIERIGNKSHVYFLEDGIVGNKKIGYKKVKYGDKIFVYTRNCYKNKRD